jgi:hypothetical protein
MPVTTIAAILTRLLWAGHENPAAGILVNTDR